MSRLPLVVALLLLLLPSSLVAQKDSTATPLPRWLIHTQEYLLGTPWQPDTLYRTAHTKLLATVGHGGVLDTYLSPITHGGWELGFKVLHDSPLRTPSSRHHTYSELSLLYNIAENASNGTLNHHFGGDFSVGPLWLLYQHSGLRLSAGPLYYLGIKSNLKLSNSNNIFSLRSSTGVDALLRASWRKEVGLYPFVLGYSVQSSLLHLTFSPHYGQSYYDFVNEAGALPVRFYLTTPFARWSMRQRLTADLPLRHTTLTLGIEHTYWQEQLNSLLFRKGALLFVVGYSFDHLSFSGNRSMRSVRLRNAYHSPQH